MSASRKSAGKCAFCEGGGLSKEHLWPAWAKPFLPERAIAERVEQQLTFSEKVKLVSPSHTKTRNGHPWTRKFRVVCRTCNNGWMSILEDQTKPVLSPIIATMPHTITTESLALIARWVVLKVMVAEQFQPHDAVFTQRQRTQFMNSGIMPENLRIWISKCGVDGWEAGYLRHAATITSPHDKLPEDSKKNTQSVALGFGDLFCFVVHSTLENVVTRLPHPPSALIPVYPIRAAVNWPPTQTPLTVHQANDIASLHVNFFRGPMVHWVQGRGSR